MGIFVRAVALFVGVSNAWVFMSMSVGGDPIRIVEDPGMLAGAARLSILPVLLVAAVAGLLTSELLLRVFRTDLEGKFLSRCATMVLAMCLGGALFGALLPLAYLLGSPGPLVNSADSPSDLIYSFLLTSMFGPVIGAMVGVFEGLILAFPLAVVLGRFRNGD